MIQQKHKEFLVNHIVDRLTEFLIQDYSYDLPTALKIIYESHTYGILTSDDSDLYIQSPDYIYHILKKELE